MKTLKLTGPEVEILLDCMAAAAWVEAPRLWRKLSALRDYTAKRNQTANAELFERGRQLLQMHQTSAVMARAYEAEDRQADSGPEAA